MQYSHPRLLWLPLLLCMLFSACATQQQTATSVQIADGITMPLLLPTQSASLTQKITGTYRGGTHTLIMQVEASPQQIVMVGLAPTGTQLFNVTFDGTQVSSWKSPLFNAPFDARYILADFELAALPLPALQAALPPEAKFTESVDDEQRKRELQNRDRETVIQIEYQGNTTRYCHRERDYCLVIEAL